MNTKFAWAIIIFILIILGAIFYFGSRGLQQPENTTATTSNVITSRSECSLKASDSITIYSRPDLKAQIFGVLQKGEEIKVAGKTENSWYGFDPVSAQAPNVGPFRLRYIKGDAQFVLSGSCDKLAIIPIIPPGICFNMAQTDIPIYSSPDESSSVVATMHFGDYVEVIGEKGEGDKSWVKVDSKNGSIKQNFTGWVTLKNVNFNGPNCDSLPQVSK